MTELRNLARHAPNQALPSTSSLELGNQVVQPPGSIGTPKPPEDGNFRSLEGGSVQVKRIPTPGGRIPTLEIRYGRGDRPGRTVWYPDVPRCWPLVKKIFQLFLRDCDNLGKPIRHIDTPWLKQN